ncbi:GAF domain-containing protein [Pedobacter cryophilus]|uniref:GAF domain-containing protein n=1 Tax=Pedobacter cryophilus TaxID=2571271 RepID=A0A4U1C3Y1_9SPHI|nr:GAF domain-containing protein [Pedobacter cryophilus]TKB99046.1 GAF domain-containing protein [Pedobacter cryophilus]
MDKNDKEVERLKAVHKYLLFDLKKEIQLIAKLASFITGTPIALITLLDREEQIVLASEGIKLDKLPRDTSFCNHAIESDEVMVVEDASKDERFQNFPSVTGELNIRFYASANLSSDDGFKIGTLCIYDVKPKKITDFEKENLQILAIQVNHILELDKQFRLSVEKNKLLAKVALIHSHKLSGPLSSILEITNLIKFDNYKFNPQYLSILEKSANQLNDEIKKITEIIIDN